MKGNESKILIGSIVVAVIIIAATYKFLYSPKVEEAEQINEQAKGIEARLNELNQKLTRRSEFEYGISSADDIITQVLKKYGPGNTPQKTIMLIVDLCNRTGAKIQSIGFGGDNLIYQSDEVDENGVPTIQFFRNSASFSMGSGYTQLKKILDYVNSHPERMNFDNLSIAYAQDTGELTTSVTLNLYSVKDKNHEYVEPVIEGIEIGNPNIFKSNEPEPTAEELAAMLEAGNTVTPTGENAEITNNTDSDETGSPEE